MTERNATNRLSLAASAVWRLRMERDPYDAMGYANDCGDLIEAGERRAVLRAVAEAGYVTPGQYNAELRERMCWDGKAKMSLRVWVLLHMLEVRDVCPSCGAALDVAKHWTRNYGGGWDTFERCPECDYAEVYV